jgi:hypothetical protein
MQNTRLTFIFFLIIIPLSLFAQKSIKGKILDEKENAVPGASIFLNNTSFGTTANNNGEFEFVIPEGKFDLIVSSIGFETYNRTIITKDLPAFLEIRLRIKSKELENVVIEPYEKDGWNRWGRFFIESFIGTSSTASNCIIKNPEVIHFRNSKATNEITATAFEPLIIVNKALGYTIHYQLETFSYNFNSHYLIFQGYPFFERQKGSSGKMKRWENRRKEVYYGSMLHFMRSIYVNSLANEGFEVHRLVKIPNKEKERVKLFFKKSDPAILRKTISKDSMDHYDQILKQQDEFDIVSKQVLTGDSIAYAINKTTAVLGFENYILIIYKNKSTPPEYRQMTHDNSMTMISQLYLINNKPVEIQPNGSYYEPADVASLGYWAWSEKIATMLPIDYVPL